MMFPSLVCNVEQLSIFFLFSQVDTLKKDQEEFITEILKELKNATLAAESLKSMVPDESSSTKTSESNKQQNTKKPKGKK